MGVEQQWVAVQEKTFTKWSVGTRVLGDCVESDYGLAVQAECQSQRSRCSSQKSSHRPLRRGESNLLSQHSAIFVQRLCALIQVYHRSPSSTSSKSSAMSPSAAMPQNPNSVSSASKMSTSPSTSLQHEVYR